MTAKEATLVSQRDSTTISTYKYRQHDKRSGKAKMSAETLLCSTEEGMVEKKLHNRSLGRELVDGQMTTQMIMGD